MANFCWELFPWNPTMDPDMASPAQSCGIALHTLRAVTSAAEKPPWRAVAVELMSDEFCIC